MNAEQFKERWGKDGVSLLLYLETRIVDHYGLVDLRHMNDLDKKNAEEMKAEGILSIYCRLPGHYIIAFDSKSSHFAELTANGWELAHSFRKSRAVLGGEKKKEMLKENYDWVIR